MKRVLRWLAIGSGVFLGLVLVAAFGLSRRGEAELSKRRVVEAEAVPIPVDSAALARGQHLVAFACRDCHGSDLTGDVVFEERFIGTIHAPNITGLGPRYTDADFVRAIRHSVAPDGRQLMIMPAEALVHLSREDLGAMIAYLKTVQRAGRATPGPRITLIGKALVALGVFGTVSAADVIDHGMPFPPMPDIGANVATGEYLSRFCSGCHGPAVDGGSPSASQSPAAPSLAGVKQWSEAQFMEFTRTGRIPSGRRVDPQLMSWEPLGRLHADELRGLYLYLSTR